MNNNINLSIVIPHFNDFKTISKILNFNFPEDVEVILVDDNSKNFYGKFNMPNNIPNFKVLQNDTGNKGAGACRNIGQSLARGKWIIYVDSDDILVENYYSILSNYFESDYDVIFFKPISYYLNTNQLADRHKNYDYLINEYLNNPSRKSELQLRYDFISPWSKLVRKSFLINNDIWFDETLAANDTMWSVKLGHFMKSYMVSDETFYHLHKRQDSLTEQKNKQLFDIRFKVRINKYIFLKSNLSSKDFKLYEPYRISQGILLMAFRKGYGIKELYEYYTIMKKNKINVFSFRLINPMFYLNKIKSRIS